RAVRERHVASSGSERAIPGLKASNVDLDAGRQGLPVPTASQQRVRCRTFDSPFLNLTGVGCHLHEDPRMRVTELHALNDARQRYRPAHVELSRKRMVSE